MPLTRCQIRNEYSLADPKLYLAADKDDPEALLEGVAMAGLVGVLRQLGDLTEFAAEIFHDLHEEVMATAARGHGLMARVQQLEAEFPSIEKAFLSQTSHSSFYYNAGVDWHPNLRMDQSLITQGDLPRFVMDSYEECRGPPRLFILDKFDVAGAGACLKRYTNPSFFKVEAAFSRTPNVEIQRDKKIRKVKKKGARGRNGETPEGLPTSNVKLHQLFLEERVESDSTDPARLVKLKKRQLNASPFDSQTKKSYMRKLLQTPSPEHRVVHEISTTPLPFKLSSNRIEQGPKTVDIQTVNSAAESLERSRSRSVSPIAQETVLKPSMGELSEEFIDGGNLKVSTRDHDREMDQISSRLHEAVAEKELAVDMENKAEGSVNGSRSDDVASETDSFMDALNTLESEIETETEHRPKNDLGFFSVEKLGRNSDADEVLHELQAQFSDSQSIGYSDASDDGNISFKMGTSSFSYSDLSFLEENTPSDGDGAAKVFPSTENHLFESVDTSSEKLSISDEILIKSHEHSSHNGACTEIVEVPNLWAECGEAYDISNCTNSNPKLLPLDLGACSREVSLVVSEQDVTFSDSNELDTRLLNTDTIRTGDILPATDNVSDIPSLKNIVPIESHPKDDLDSNVLTDGLLHLSSDSDLALQNNSRKFGVNELLQTGNADDTSHKISQSDSLANLPSDSDPAPEKNCSENVVDEELLTDYADDASLEKIINKNFGSPVLNVSSTGEQFISSNLSELEPPLGITLQPNYLPASTAHCPDAENPDNIVSENDTISAAVANSENSAPVVDTTQSSNFSEQKFSERTDGFLTHEINSAEVGGLHYGDRTDLKGIYSTKVFEEVDGYSSSKDGKESGPLSSQFSSEYPNYASPEDHVHKEHMVTGSIQSEAEAVMAIAAANIDEGRDANHLTQDFPCSSSRKSMNMQESLSTFGDLRQKGLNNHELSPPECLIESGAQEEVSQSAVGQGDAGSMPLSAVSYDYSHSKPPNDIPRPSLNNFPIDDASKSSTSSQQNSQHTEFPGDISGLYQIDQDQNSSPIGDFTTSPTSSKQNEQDIGSDSPHQTHFSDNTISTGSLSTSYFPHPGNHLEQALELIADQLDVESVHADKVITKLSILHSEQLQDSDNIPQERCFSASTESSLEGFPDHASMSDFLLQSARIKLQSYEQAMAPSESVFPSLGLLPQASQDSPEEMPPLPPLPPMQWRIGKFQHASPASGRQSLEQSLASFPPILPSTAVENAQFGFLASEGKIQQPQSSVLSPSDVKDEKLQQVSEHLAGPSLFSVQIPTMASDAYNQHNLLTLGGGEESLNPFLPLQVMCETAQDGFLASEGEIQQPQNSVLPPSDVKDEKLQQVSEHLAGPSLFSKQIPTMASDAYNQHNLLTIGGGEESLNPFLPLQAMSETAQDGFIASEGEIQQPQNSVLSPSDVKDEKLQQVSDHLAGPSLFSEHIPRMASDACNQHNLLTLGGGAESLNPFLPLQAMSEMPQDGFLAPEGERTQLTSNPFSLEPLVQIASTLHSPVPLPGNQLLPPNQQALERDLEDIKFLHTSQNSEGEKVNNPMEFVPPPMLEDQQPQLDLQIPASENGKPNGDTLTKVPRPRNPLIDAVAAHDKSKLRKVTERARPQIEHMVDERDSLLEQIRTKSFNLKPAVVTRPSIQGPKTNLKLAAILEKANAIRQAFAGSDEDDEDNWSDN